MTLNGYAINIENFIVYKNNYVDNIVILNELDRATLVHSRNVLKLSKMLGKEVGLNSAQMKDLHMGALFHDVGKVFIPKKILNNTDKLTDEEFEIIKTHSKYGYEYMKDNSNLSDESLRIILEHHERPDGKGYPDNKTNDELSILSKIVSVCDVYDALVSKRSYKKAFSVKKAIGILNDIKGSQLDENLVDLLCCKVIPLLNKCDDDVTYNPS
jgi:HD-GYP domain-containing protein (c-di-GMP phosphodiesterase class II)